MKRRLIVCADGTWNSIGQRYPTNVVKFARAIAPTAPDGVSQVVFYDQGVGTGNILDRLTGGAFGNGLEQNISDCYHFLLHNYAEGDEIFLFGFSRGAYTVRSLAGLVRKCGILRKAHANRFRDAHALYRRSDIHPDDEAAKKFREDHSRIVEITCLGVWDTVGALGIPVSGLRRLTKGKHQFHDVELSRFVRNGFHAISIDERRKAFAPSIWANKVKAGQRVEQVWFAGAHTDIGGGNRSSGLSDIALDWMAGKAAFCGLAFDVAYLKDICHPDGNGPLHLRIPWFYRFLGSFKRRLGRGGLNESVHPEAIARYRSPTMAYHPENLTAYLSEQGDNGPAA